jgi:hypothetical protein
MIIAALYVVLLVGFSRETYVVRGYHLAGSSAAACADASKQICTPDHPTCTPVAPAAEEPSCVVSVRVLRRLIDQRGKPPASELEAIVADETSDQEPNR